jgi:hypothetical protein
MDELHLHLERHGTQGVRGGPWGSNQLEFVDAPPTGGNLANLAGIASSFAPDYAPEEILEIATKLYKKPRTCSLVRRRRRRVAGETALERRLTHPA